MSDYIDSQPTPAQGDTGATPAPASTGTPAAPQATPVAQPQAPATGASPHGTEGMVPSYRLREYSQRIQQMQQQLQEAQKSQHEVETLRRQIQALTGVQTPNPQVNRAEQIKSQFFEIFPNAKNLFDKAEMLEKLAERLPDLEEQQNHYWGAYGRNALNSLYSTAEQYYGGPLTEQGRALLKDSLVAYLQSRPDQAQRYAEDPSVVQDFWKEYSAALIDPVRRGAAAQTAARVPQHLPQDTPGNAVPFQQAPKPANMDERAASAWAILEQFRSGNR